MPAININHRKQIELTNTSKIRLSFRNDNLLSECIRESFDDGGKS